MLDMDDIEDANLPLMNELTYANLVRLHPTLLFSSCPNLETLNVYFRNCLKLPILQTPLFAKSLHNLRIKTFSVTPGPPVAHFVSLFPNLRHLDLEVAGGWTSED